MVKLNIRESNQKLRADFGAEFQVTKNIKKETIIIT